MACETYIKLAYIWKRYPAMTLTLMTLFVYIIRAAFCSLPQMVDQWPCLGLQALLSTIQVIDVFEEWGSLYTEVFIKTFDCTLYKPTIAFHQYFVYLLNFKVFFYQKMFAYYRHFTIVLIYAWQRKTELQCWGTMIYTLFVVTSSIHRKRMYNI